MHHTELGGMMLWGGFSAIETEELIRVDWKMGFFFYRASQSSTALENLSVKIQN